MTDTKLEHCDHPVARNDVIDLPRFVNGIRELVLGQLHGILDADGYDRVRSVDPAWLTNTVLESQAQPLPIRPHVYISETEEEAFNRFCECCEDSGADGYDVSQEMMKRLTEVGLVRSLGFKRYTTTRYGDAIRSLKQQAPESVAKERFTEDQIVAAARALADRNAEICNVNKEDNWAIYGSDFIEDARSALSAIEADRKRSASVVSDKQIYAAAQEHQTAFTGRQVSAIRALLSAAPRAPDGWRKFGAKVLADARENLGADVDGGDIQDWAEEAGLLVKHCVSKSCGEHCICAEVGFPSDCYRYSDEAMEAVNAIAAPQSKE